MRTSDGWAAVRCQKMGRVSAKGGIGVVRAWSGRPPTGADQAGVVLPAGLPGDCPAASMLEFKPGSGFFSVFSGFRVRLSRTFPQRSPQGAPSGHAGNARRGGPGRPEGDSLRVPDGRGPACRQAAVAAVRSSHIRRSRRRALAVTPGPRMTATGATLWGFPLSRSRWYRCHETIRRLPSRVIRCKGMTMVQHVVAGGHLTATPAR